VCATDRVPICAFGPGPVRASAALDALPAETADHLRRGYGANAGAVASLVAERPELGEAMVSGLPNLKAEVVYAARHEMARHLSDVLARRTHVVQLDREQGRAVADEVARLLGAELGWSVALQAAEVERFRAEVRQFSPSLAVAGA
jgi:glycerol-3-phosphate dehydrogenase